MENNINQRDKDTMRKFFCFILTLAFCSMAWAQKHEIGLSLGGVNAISDIGRTNYINPLPYKNEEDKYTLPISIGALYRYNFNPYMGFRFMINYHTFGGNDKWAVEDYRVRRGYAYNNDIIEGGLLFEYNFFPINEIQKFAHSPYIFVGGAFYGYNKLNYTITHALNTDADGNPILPTTDEDFNTTVTSESTRKFDWGIPFGAGYKVKFKHNWVLGFEIGVRATANDRLDYSFSNASEDFIINVQNAELLQDPYAEILNQRTADQIAARQTGNLTNSDWYVFTGINLTYTFGRPPCFCR